MQNIWSIYLDTELLQRRTNSQTDYVMYTALIFNASRGKKRVNPKQVPVSIRRSSKIDTCVHRNMIRYDTLEFTRVLTS